MRALAILLATLVAGATAPAGAAEREWFAGAFPGADRFGPMSGDPPAASAYAGDALAGYVFSTREVVGSVGFSGKPLDILVGLGLDGRIAGAVIVEQNEPILIIGVSEADLDAFVSRYLGHDIRQPVRFQDTPREGEARFDAVSGATVSSLVINDAILRSARAVARTRGILGGSAAALDFDSFTPAGWEALLVEGAIARLELTRAAVDSELRALGASGYGPALVERDPAARFIDLYAALATPAAIGRNLVGARIYERLMGEITPGAQVIFVAARGLYSFKGTAWRRAGVFDRFQIVQGERSFALTRGMHRRVDTVAAEGAPELRELGLFVLPAASGFDPAAPWRLDLMVPADTADGPVFATFILDYRIPERLVRRDSAEVSEELWKEIWRDQAADIAVLALALVALTGILVFQQAVVRHRELHRGLRYAFLAFTLVWMGWYAGAQLSVVNVLTFAQSLLSEFRWEVFLVAPLIFILWGFVAVAMLFWGRGVYCGWLCPFGALQELLNRAGRLVHIPQYRVPFAVHERLWPIKYILFLALFALSLGGLEQVQWAIEVEPFKTAIILGFLREWPFVAYVVVLLAAGLFVERAFCRYLCPLGAALAIPARMHMFQWLQRRWQCGRQCRICEQQCLMQAIHPDGHINPNECVHCLNCQVLYMDDQTCPPLIERRKRREASQRARESIGS